MNANKTLLHVDPNHQRIEHTTRGFNDGGWREVRFDIDPSVKPDILGTMTDMKNAETGRFDAIYSSHNIEHLFPHEVAPAIREFQRVLNHTGFVVLTCPDLQAVAEKVAEGNLDAPLYHSAAGPICAIDIPYGHRASMASGNHYMAHKIGFTQQTLLSSFLLNGFSSAVAIRDSAYALWIIATKSQSSADEMRKLTSEHFPAHITLV